MLKASTVYLDDKLGKLLYVQKVFVEKVNEAEFVFRFTSEVLLHYDELMRLVARSRTWGFVASTSYTQDSNVGSILSSKILITGPQIRTLTRDDFVAQVKAQAIRDYRALSRRDKW